MKKHSILAFLLVFVMCLSMVMTGCGDSTESKKKEITLDQAADNTLNALFDSDCSIGAFEDMSEKKVVTISMDNLFTNVLNMDLANLSFYDDLTVTAEGQTVNLNLYCDGSDLAITAPELLGEQALGINFSTLAEDLETSGLLAALESEMGMTMSELMDILTQYEDLTSSMNPDETMNGLFSNLTDVAKDLEETKEEGTVTVYDEEVDAIIFTYTIEKEDITKLMDALLDSVGEVYSQMADGMVSASLVPADAIESVDFAELQTQLNAAMEQIEIGGTVSMAVNPENGCIMRIDAPFSATSDSGKLDLTMELVLGKNPAETDKINLNISGVNSEGSELVMTMALNSTTSGSVDTTAFDFSFDIDGETGALNFTSTYNNDSNDYDLSLTVDGEKVLGAKGQMESTDSKFSIRIDEVYGDGETVPLALSLSVENDPNCEIPAVPEYTNILTEMDLAGLLGSM